jgi:hypothetical protein
MFITLRELEILAALRQHWIRLHFAELRRLLRELDGPYLFRPRALPRARVRRWQRQRRRMPAARHHAMRRG